MRFWIIATLLLASADARADGSVPAPAYVTAPAPPSAYAPAPAPAYAPTPPSAPAPAPAPALVYEPPPAPACHLVRPYLEPSYLVGGEVELHRLALGLAVRDCSGRERPFHARIAPTVHVASDQLVGWAYGLEAEAGLQLSRTWRTGLRLGFETGAWNQSLATLGLRFRAGNVLVLGIDAYSSSYRYDNFSALPLERRRGVMAGLSFDGKLGPIIVAAEALLLVAAIALAPPS